MNHTKLLQSALEAMRGYRQEHSDAQPCDTERAIEAALAEQAAAEPDCSICPACGGMAADPIVPVEARQKEPVAFDVRCEHCGGEGGGRSDATEWRWRTCKHCDGEGFVQKMLYTTPQAQPAREPLTDDAKDAERYRWLKSRMMGADFDWNESGACALVFEWPRDVPVGANCDRNIDSAIEAAHGITSKKGGAA